jgi:hypothetical protein
MSSHDVAPTTTRSVTTLLVLLLVGAASLLPGFAPTPTQVAEAAERCDGVWVVVEAAALGGPNTTRCAPGRPSSGLAALEAAGHRYSFVPRIPGMVCTIDGRPDPCNGAPSDAYWSYWHAEAGGTWTYSTRGAGSRTPPPGSVEGWAFGAGDPPRTPPPSNAPAPEPTATSSPSPTPTSSPAPSPSPSPTATSSPPPPSNGSPSPPPEASSSATREDELASDSTSVGEPPDETGAAEEDAAPADEGSPDPSDRSDSSSASTLAAPERPTPDATERPEAGDERPPVELRQQDPDDAVAIAVPAGGGTTAGLVAGGALAAAIAGAGILQARRRRQAFGS